MNKPLAPTDLTDAAPRCPRIVLFVEADSGDWHARRLARALETRGASVVTTTLAHCAFDTRMASGIDIPGFAGALPAGEEYPLAGTPCQLLHERAVVSYASGVPDAFPQDSFLIEHGLDGRVMAEIDDRIRAGHGRGEIVPDIDRGEDMQFRIAGGAGDERLAHPSVGSIDDQFERFHHGMSWRLRRVDSNFLRVVSPISHRGRRTSGFISPRRASAYFAGTGLGSMKRSLKSG